MNDGKQTMKYVWSIHGTYRMRKVLMLKFRHKKVWLYPPNTKHPGEREKGSQVLRDSIGFFLNSEDKGM